MVNSVTVIPASNTPYDMVKAGRRANDYMAAAKAANTTRAYAADWKHFANWCESHGLAALPSSPEVVTLYVSEHAGALKVSTIERRLNAINFRHRQQGFEAPTVHPGLRETMKGIRKAHGTRRDGKPALSIDDIRAIANTLPETMAGKRDRALILLGFAGAFRRSELVALNVADVVPVAEGLEVTVKRSKTDQDGQGSEVGIARGAALATCPVRAVEEWLTASGAAEGPVFRAVDRHGRVRRSALSGYAVCLIVQRAAAAAGVAAPQGDTFGAHSLRAGHATSAARAGIEERTIMRQGRWKSEKTVRGYIRHGSLFVDNSSGRLGL